jgi:hypothetical protein
MARTDWTKEEIKEMLGRNDKAVLRGLMAIYNLQTADEQALQATAHHNGVGFSGCDAELLSSFAVNYTKYGRLTEKQMAILRNKIKKYAGQLTKIANGEIPRIAL